MRQKSPKRRGQSIIETVVGIIFMIPIVLLLFDVAILVLGNTANDNLAKQAARAAASAIDSGTNTGSAAKAQAAAQNIVDRFGTSGFIQKVEFAYIWYHDNTNTQTTVNTGNLPDQPPGLATSTDPGVGNVAVVTGMQVNPPVPFPGIGGARSFFARAVEPIVAIPPQ